MVPLLSELWRIVQYAFRPEDHSDGAQYQPLSRPGPRASAWEGSALAGALKTLFWACLAILAGLGLGQLAG